MYLAVVDRDGNIASVIQSLSNTFGADVAVEGRGFHLHNGEGGFSIAECTATTRTVTSGSVAASKSPSPSPGLGAATSLTAVDAVLNARRRGKVPHTRGSRLQK
jgi:gamma-glutamyltranspeptidase